VFLIENRLKSIWGSLLTFDLSFILHFSRILSVALGAGLCCTTIIGLLVKYSVAGLAAVQSVACVGQLV